MSNVSVWRKGVKDGFPIFLGYLAVSFTFGIAAKNAGLSCAQAVLDFGYQFHLGRAVCGAEFDRHLGVLSGNGLYTADY